MMDYYSDFPAPPETEVIQDITSKLATQEKYKSRNIFTIKKKVKKALEDMGGHKSLGSYSGYVVFSKKELIQRTEQLLDNSNKMVTFRTIVKIVIALNNTYNVILHNRYKPNGIGYHEAKLDYNSKLPPIGNKKKLYTPVKENVGINNYKF